MDGDDARHAGGDRDFCVAIGVCYDGGDPMLIYQMSDGSTVKRSADFADRHEMRATRPLGAPRSRRQARPTARLLAANK
jgi:hypothetical protein